MPQRETEGGEEKTFFFFGNWVAVQKKIKIYGST